MQKADIQSEGDQNSNYAADNETVIQLNSQRFWLYAIVDPDRNEFLDVRFFPTRPLLTTQFLQKLHENYVIVDSLPFVDNAPWLRAVLFGLALRFHWSIHGYRDRVEQLFTELKHHTEQFATHFDHVTAESTET